MQASGIAVPSDHCVVAQNMPRLVVEASLLETVFGAVFEESRIGAALIKFDGTLCHYNRAYWQIINEHQLDPFSNLVNDFPLDTGSEFLTEFRQGRMNNYEIAKQYIGEDQESFWLYWHISVVRTHGRTPCYILALVRDITEQRLLANKLQYYRKQLRHLASQVSLAEEQERRRIAIDLHDNVGALLATSKLKLQFIKQRVANNIANDLQEVINRLEHLVDYTRSLTYQLSPAILYEVGLMAAIKWLGHELSRQHSLVFSFTSKGFDDSCGGVEQSKVICFMCVRELLLNVIKHAHASTIKVSVEHADNELKISVIDDGVGFEFQCPYIMTKNGFGLFSIQERLGHFGGKMDVRSELGQGSTVTITIPFEKTGDQCPEAGVITGGIRY